MSDPIFGAIDELKRRIDDQVAQLKQSPVWDEVVRLRQALNTLEEVAKTEHTGLAAILGLGEEDSESISKLVKFDEFYGIKTLDAAKRYLKKRTDARPFDEIVAAIKAGGGTVDSEDGLKLGLSRSTLDIVKIGDRYGAIENYSHIKRGGRKKTAQNATTTVHTVNETEDEEEEDNEAASK